MTDKNIQLSQEKIDVCLIDNLSKKNQSQKEDNQKNTQQRNLSGFSEEEYKIMYDMMKNGEY